MKKIFVLSAAAVMAMAMTSCHSGESAYKKAYEKAQAAQAATQQVVANTVTQATTPVTTPVQPTTTTQTPAETPDYSNERVRTEDVTVVNGDGLKAYSVIVGSFSVQANAVALMNKLKGEGHNSQVVKSPSNMYRVVYDTYNDKSDAARCKNNVSSQYNGAWLLYQK